MKMTFLAPLDSNEDTRQFAINLSKACEHLQAWYEEHKDKLENIPLANGKKLDFGRKSLMRIGMKAFLVGFALPMLEDMYASRGLVITPRIKHEDLIDYLVKNALELAAAIEKDIDLYADYKISESGYRNVAAISTVEPTNGNVTRIGSATSRDREETPSAG